MLLFFVGTPRRCAWPFETSTQCFLRKFRYGICVSRQISTSVWVARGPRGRNEGRGHAPRIFDFYCTAFLQSTVGVECRSSAETQCFGLCKSSLILNHASRLVDVVSRAKSTQNHFERQHAGSTPVIAEHEYTFRAAPSSVHPQTLQKCDDFLCPQCNTFVAPFNFHLNACLSQSSLTWLTIIDSSASPRTTLCGTRTQAPFREIQVNTRVGIRVI